MSEQCPVEWVWTGTARTPNHYRGVRAERTFATAYLEYGQMVAMVLATGRKVWFLLGVQPGPALQRVERGAILWWDAAADQLAHSLPLASTYEERSLSALPRISTASSSFIYRVAPLR